MIADTFKALGDPARIEMVRRLSMRPVCTVGYLSDGLGITRQGARKHLAVLSRARLVKLSPKGRETEVTLDVEALHYAKVFIDEMAHQWEQRLDALRDVIEADARPE